VKRVNNLFESVVSHDNLMTAFRLAMKGCGKTEATCRFFFHLEPEIIRLQKELTDGIYQPGAYRYFTVYDPKQRTIAVAPFRDRVVHHAVVRILASIYERVFIYDSYATRPQKGTHMAIKRAQTFLRKWPWFLKADVSQYFYSVDHDILLRIIERKIKDRRLLELMERIVRNTKVPGKGLPIGNLTSQFLANVYLDPLDHEIKDRMGIKGYLRYMDDFIVFGNTRDELLSLKRKIEQFLSDELSLYLKSNVTCLNRSGHGLSFLGMRIYPNLIRVKPENRRRSLKRMARMIHRWEAGRIEEDQLSQSIASVVGHLRYFCPNMKIALGAATV
jgi:RNA-directed DNA polymerase